MNKAVRLLALAGLAVLAACQSEKGDLEGARIGGPFSLVDQNGHVVRWSDFDGQYRLVYFGYTYCPDVCPLDLAKIMAGYRLLEKSDPAKAARIQPMMISVDPQRDTPAALKTYVAAFHPRLIGLTGTAAQIETVKKEFAVLATKEGPAGATQDYLVSHSRTPFLFGPDGRPIALIPTADEAKNETENGAMVRDVLAKWVK